MNSEKEIVENIDIVIDGMIRDLNQYVNRGNANQYIVNRNNAYIERLTNARNYIASIANSVDYHILMSLLHDIADLEKKDPELTGHIIKLCKNKGDRYGYLTKCL